MRIISGNPSLVSVWSMTLWGLAGGLLTYAAVEGLLSGIRVSVWHHSLYLSLAYGVILALSAYVPLDVRQGRAVISWPFAGMVVVLSVVLTAPTVVGALPGAGLSGVVIGLTLVTRRILRRKENHRWNLSPAEALVLALLSAAAVGGVWVVQTAPAYAEGFVVLAWALLVLGHLVVLVPPALFSRRDRRRSTENRSVRWSGALALSGLSALIASGCLVYAVLAEGVRPPPLQPAAQWPEAFRQIQEPVASLPKEGLRKAQFTREDLVQLLRDSDSEEPAHIATLYLLTDERSWSKRFKEVILDQVARDKYTGAEGSIKYGQRYAMLWAMYFREISQRDPELFSEAEYKSVVAWMLRIAKAQFQPGWVDYLYAMPFRDDPDGPYLNQEIGAGLAAVLNDFVQASENADLKARFQRFLDTKSVGWRGNYRNQDDSLEYQEVWMGSAHALFRYVDKLDSSNAPGLKFGVEWLKRQLPKPPEKVNYGLPSTFRPIDTLAMGAFLLGDPESKAMLEQHLIAIRDGSEELPKGLTALWLWRDDVPAQTGLQPSVVLDGPTGYTFRPGELRPDKIVLRDQSPDGGEIYALSSLRNAGWHRYPATNTLIRLSLGGDAWVAEDLVYKKHRWLPAGRASHRDKKVDRSRLNGVTMEREGLDAWLGSVTGIYSRWRQDVPDYAEVGFTGRLGELQVVQSIIEDWDGLQQKRWQVLDPSGGLLIVDRLLDDSKREKSIFWHLTDRVKNLDLPDQTRVEGAVGTSDLRILASPEKAVALHTGAQEDSLPQADPDAAITHFVRAASRARSFATASYFSKGSHMLPDAVFLPSQDSGEDQWLGAEDWKRLLVLGSGQDWRLDEVHSNATATQFTKRANGADLLLQRAGYIEIAPCAQIDRVTLNGVGLLPVDCRKDRWALPLAEQQVDSGVALSLFYR